MEFIKNKLKVLIRNLIREEISKIDMVKLNDFYKRYDFDKSVKFGRVRDIFLTGDNIFIGNNTYINSGILQSGPNSKVIIGEWCAIGYNVNIISITHDIDNPTGPIESRKVVEADINIGNNCWIGTNVFVREGVTIGDNSIVAANSVVTKNFDANSIIGGVPAKLIRKK